MQTEELNAKQLRFVEEYLKDLNASAAYQRAGYKAEGKSAGSAGARLLADVRVQAAVKAGMDARSERTAISAAYVLETIQGVIEKAKQPGMAYDAGAVLKGSELLGRHLKMFTDKIDHSGAVSVQIIRYGKEPQQ